MRTRRRNAARLLGGLCALLALGSAAAVGAAPRLIDASGVLRDAAGDPLTGTVNVVFALHDGAEGDVLWSEVLAVTAEEGAFQAVLGSDPTNPLPEDAFRGAAEPWLGLQAEGELPLPRQRLLSVPFALEARHSARARAASLDCVGCVDVAALTVTPASEAALAALEPRVVALESALPGLGGTTLARLPCDAGAVPGHDGAAWGCRDDVVASDEVAAAAIVAVDGLAGGAILGDVDVVGTLAAAALRQDGHLVCDASGNCGPTLAGVTCAAGEVLRRDGAGWGCGTLPPPKTPPVCDGPGQALQWDGSDWRCVRLTETGPSVGAAAGFEAVDEWGFVWDGGERGAKTWAEAVAACEAVGGRLPTVTELWRNNAATGTGNFATARHTAYLWTAITDHRGYGHTVRLSDGTVGAGSMTATNNFRCVWPDHRSDAFDGDHCHGPLGDGCAVARRFYHVDRADRPPLDFVAASHECNFYNASLPTVAEWTDLIHAGAAENGSDQWVWAAGVLYYTSSPYFLNARVRWSDATAATFSYTDLVDGELGRWDWPTDRHHFRCIGKRDAAIGIDPPAPACEGGCLVVRPNAVDSPSSPGRRAPIWADQRDRAPALRAEAMATCEALGGTLPTFIEAQELVHHGWADGTNEWLWTATPMYAHSSGGLYRSFIVRWAGTGTPTFYAHGFNTLSTSNHTEPRAFRCVWHQTVAEALPGCPGGEAPQWDGVDWSCAPIVPGDDGDDYAVDGGFTDPWGNVWDAADRPLATREDAAALCAAVGGRLPTATELFRVRAAGDAPAPAATTAALWTRLPSYRAGYALTLRLSDGGAADECTGTDCQPHGYRCVWPASGGNVFGGPACADRPGPDGTSCFRAAHVRMDAGDRARIPVAAAAAECAFHGGWLADGRTLETAIRAGLPNGDWNAWSMLIEPAWDGSFFTLSARWSGTGDGGWYFNDQVTATAGVRHHVDTFDTFRCVDADWLW